MPNEITVSIQKTKKLKKERGEQERETYLNLQWRYVAYLVHGLHVEFTGDFLFLFYPLLLPPSPLLLPPLHLHLDALRSVVLPVRHLAILATVSRHKYISHQKRL